MDIYIDSLSKSARISDLTKNRNKLKTKEFVFDTPYIPETIRDNINYLKINSIEIAMNDRYYMRPDYVAFDYYGTTNLYYIILILNSCRSFEEFTMSNIVIPTKESIFHILKRIKPSTSNINE